MKGNAFQGEQGRAPETLAHRASPPGGSAATWLGPASPGRRPPGRQERKPGERRQRLALG